MSKISCIFEYKLKRDIMKTNNEVTIYLRSEVNEKLVSIINHNLGLIITCHVKSMFPTKSDYTRVKGYLRRNGFIANGLGTHIRPDLSENKDELYSKGYWKSSIEFHKLKK